MNPRRPWSLAPEPGDRPMAADDFQKLFLRGLRAIKRERGVAIDDKATDMLVTPAIILPTRQP